MRSVTTVYARSSRCSPGDYSWLQYLLRLRYIWSRVPGKRKFNQLTALLVLRGMCVCVCTWGGYWAAVLLACLINKVSLHASLSLACLTCLTCTCCGIAAWEPLPEDFATLSTILLPRATG